MLLLLEGVHSQLMLCLLTSVTAATAAHVGQLCSSGRIKKAGREAILSIHLPMANCYYYLCIPGSKKDICKAISVNYWLPVVHY